jgi:phosphoglycolate phosphatase
MGDVQVVIFDCDGVMFDSKEANTAYYNDILNHFNRPVLTLEQLAYAHQHAVNAVLSYLFDGSEALEAARAYQQNMGYRQFIQYMKMEPDLRDLLEWLKPRYKTAIATNRTYTMGWVLEEFRLNTYFDLVICAGDVAHPKPEPDMLVKILEYFRIEPHQAIYVGDSPVDESAASAAGLPLVAYANPSLSAAYHINRLKEIRDILDT